MSRWQEAKGRKASGMHKHTGTNVMTPTKREIICQAIGIDYSEFHDCEYQPGKHSPLKIYTDGWDYYCLSKGQPAATKHTEYWDWKKHPDQFWAEQADTTVWVCHPPKN